MVVQRGGHIWRPQVTPLNEVRHTPQGPTVTQTSLAASPQGFRPAGASHNTKAVPFAQAGGRKLVTSAYNTPAGMHSDTAIAEALTKQAEILDQGVVGIDFKKYHKEEKPIEASPTFKLLHGLDEQQSTFNPRTVPIQPDEEPEFVKQKQKLQKGVVATSPTFAVHDSPVQGQSFKLLERSLGDNIEPYKPSTPTPRQSQVIPPGENICAVCGRLVVGVFLKVKNKNVHAECFRCVTCGMNLKNKGYYYINEKTYCDIHAGQAARQNPPAPNLEPVAVNPGSPAPRGAMTAAQALASKGAASPSSPRIMASSQSSPMKPPGGVKLMPSVFSPIPYKPASASGTAPPPFTPSSPLISSPVKNLDGPPFVKSPAAPQNFGAPAREFNVGSNIPQTGGVSAPSFLSSNLPSSSLVDLPRPTAPPTFTPQRGVVQMPGQRSAPRRGRGIVNPASGSRVPICSTCHRQIRGPFVSALGKTWCPEHFMCGTSSCRRQLIDIGFVEEKDNLYCENCYERYLAPTCGKCDKRIKGDCLNAISKHFHPECFCCAYCGRVFGSGAFYLEDGLPYCENDWNDLFTTKCFGCQFPIEAGDRWVEALNNNFHSQCFKCSVCKSNLEGKSFYAKNGRPFCKGHASR